MAAQSFEDAKRLFRQHSIDLKDKYTVQLVSQVDGLLDQAYSTGINKVAIHYQIQQQLLQVGLAWHAHCVPERAGVSPHNRSRLGVVAADSQHLGGEVLDQGWNDKKTEESSAFQIPPPPLDVECKVFNQEIVILSDGLIPPLDDVDILTVGGSHTNTFLRQVNGGVTAVVKSLSDTGEVGGKLNREQLVCNRPEFKIALQRGLKFFTMDWQATFVWPRLADFFQDALNITAKLIVSEPEVMLKLSLSAAAAEKAGLPLDWSAFEAQATKSNPACASWVTVLSTYVQLNGGGVAGNLLQELQAFSKTVQDGGAKRLLGSDFLTKINGVKFGKGVHFPYVINAAVELHLAGPKVKDGFCQFLQGSNLLELTKSSNRVEVARAEDMLTASRQLVQSIGVARSKVVKFIGRLDTRVAAKLMKKGQDLEGKTLTLTEIATLFLSDLSTVHGQPIQWSITDSASLSPKADEKKIDDESKSALKFKSVDTVEQKTDPVYQAQKLGFVPGVHAVESTVVNVIYKLTHWKGTKATMAKQENGHSSTESQVDANTVLSSWRVHKGTVTELLPGYTESNRCSPLDTKSLKWDIAKAKIVLAVSDAYSSYEKAKTADSLELLIKPTKVKTTAHIAIGELQLFPISVRFETKRADSAWFVGQFDLGEKELTSVYMSSMNVPPLNAQGQPNKSPWVCPFWLVQSKDKGPWNMEVRCSWHGDVKVPALVNRRKLHPGEDLVYNSAAVGTFAVLTSELQICQQAILEKSPSSSSKRRRIGDVD